jgi:multidrug resistance efflux pump
MAVKIKRERPDQRRHHRVTAPMYVHVGGQKYRAADWSLGGLRIVDYSGELPTIGAELPCHLTLPFQGFDVTFDAKAEVVRLDVDSRMVALRYTELGERERELMSHFIEELVRGTMVDVEDTIQRIDVPVTPASLQPDASPSKALPARRRPTKALVMSAVYAALGFIVFGYTGLLLYTNFYRLEVQTAVIASPVETVASQAEGRIKIGSLKPGDPVRAGDSIVTLVDHQLEREIELAEIAVKEQKAKLIFMKRRQADELERLQSFAAIDLKGAEQIRIEIDGLTSQLHLAEAQLVRLTSLQRKGYTTDTKVDEAHKAVIALRHAIEGKRVELKSRIELAGANVGKRHYNGTSLIGEIGQIEAQVRLAEHEIQLAHQKFLALANHRARLAVTAPFDGTILELPHVDNGHVRRGDVIAIIEQRSKRHVLAFLNQDEVMRVGIGDEVTLFLAALGESLKGRVVSIDRTSAFISEQNSRQNPGYRWRGPVDRTAKVTIAFSEPSKVADAERYRSGLPVIVVFPQRSTNSLLASIRGRIDRAM